MDRLAILSACSLAALSTGAWGAPPPPMMMPKPVAPLPVAKAPAATPPARTTPPVRTTTAKSAPVSTAAHPSAAHAASVPSKTSVPQRGGVTASATQRAPAGAPNRGSSKVVTRIGAVQAPAKPSPASAGAKLSSQTASGGKPQGLVTSNPAGANALPVPVNGATSPALQQAITAAALSPVVSPTGSTAPVTKPSPSIVLRSNLQVAVAPQAATASSRFVTNRNLLNTTGASPDSPPAGGSAPNTAAAPASNGAGNVSTAAPNGLVFTSLTPPASSGGSSTPAQSLNIVPFTVGATSFQTVATQQPAKPQQSATTVGSGWSMSPKGEMRNPVTGQIIPADQVPLVLPTVADPNPKNPMFNVPPPATASSQAQLQAAITSLGLDQYGRVIPTSPFQSDNAVAVLAAQTPDTLTRSMAAFTPAQKVVAQNIIAMDNYVGEATTQYAKLTPSQLEGLLVGKSGPTKTPTLSPVEASVAGAVLLADYTKQYQGLTADQAYNILWGTNGKSITSADIQSGSINPSLTAAQKSVLNAIAYAPPSTSGNFATVQVTYDPPPDKTSSGSHGIFLGALFGQSAPGEATTGNSTVDTIERAATGTILGGALVLGGGAVVAPAMLTTIMPTIAAGVAGAGLTGTAAMLAGGTAATSIVAATLGASTVTGIVAGGAGATLLSDLGSTTLGSPAL